MIRFLIILAIATVLFSSCEKRSCRCEYDLTLDWSETSDTNEIYVELPMAVLDTGAPLTILIFSVDKPVEWNLTSVKFKQGNTEFINSSNPSDFKLNNSRIQFPHELFIVEDGGLVRGAVDAEIKLFFPEENRSMEIVGSFYFYRCAEMDEDFEWDNCIWSEQILGLDYPEIC